jgi:hypothetical protein
MLKRHKLIQTSDITFTVHAYTIVHVKSDLFIQIIVYKFKLNYSEIRCNVYCLMPFIFFNYNQLPLSLLDNEC